MIRIIVPIQTDFLQYTFLLLYNTIITVQPMLCAGAADVLARMHKCAYAWSERLLMSKEAAASGKHNSATLRLTRAQLLYIFRKRHDMNLNEYQNYREVKSHTTAGFPYNTYLCSIPKDFPQVPLHWHAELELIVIKKGRGIVSVDLEKRSVTSGDIILIRPGQLHSIEQDQGYFMEYENIIMKPDLLISGENDLCAIRFIYPFINGEIPSDTYLTPAVSYYKDVSECIRQIDLLCDTKTEGYQLAVKGLLFQFFFLLISNRQKKETASVSQTKSLEKMKTILKYVEEHYDEHITIDDMAALTYYSKSHFMKFFKQHMGTGFIDYLNDYRLTMAERLLKSSDSPVLEIAAQSGFDNLSYFNRIFKRKYGISPGKWRTQ